MATLILYLVGAGEMFLLHYDPTARWSGFDRRAYGSAVLWPILASAVIVATLVNLAIDALERGRR